MSGISWPCKVRETRPVAGGINKCSGREAIYPPDNMVLEAMNDAISVSRFPARGYGEPPPIGGAIREILDKMILSSHTGGASASSWRGAGWR